MINELVSTTNNVCVLIIQLTSFVAVCLHFDGRRIKKKGESLSRELYISTGINDEKSTKVVCVFCFCCFLLF